MVKFIKLADGPYIHMDIEPDTIFPPNVKITVDRDKIVEGIENPEDIGRSAETLKRVIAKAEKLRNGKSGI